MQSTRNSALAVVCLSLTSWLSAADGVRHHSDSDARYVHHIDLYDIDNRKITPDSDRPYSAVHTCGRCHDYQTIAHGWHFNAFLPDPQTGRRGEPWIWTDPRTATQLPLSYRPWEHTFNPVEVGLTRWEMALQFGGRIPGVHLPGDSAEAEKTVDTEDEPATDETAAYDRWPLSGALEVDCMLCHAVSGGYDFSQRRSQIEDQNFAWAPTAGLRLGTVSGAVSRIKDGADVEDESVQEKLPKVAYDPRRFAPDGTVFMDLVRQPPSNACYQCHSTRTVTDDGIEARWLHDEDIHLRAGMDCADCHRNGIDHHTVRGFAGEQHPSGQPVATLSCAGCHLGDEPPDADEAIAVALRAGRLGSPRPLHRGLPPVHFEKLSCTACHSGPAPRETAIRVMTSLAHGLGTAEHRSGTELPAIVAPLYTKLDDGRLYPQKGMWPAYWGSMVDGKVRPLSPETVYSATRRTLRVRNDFVEEILQPKPKSSDLKEWLGEQRAKLDPEQWSDEERSKVAAGVKQAGQLAFHEKVSAALQALEQELELEQAVFVSTGIVYARSVDEDKLQEISVDDPAAAGLVTWPLAHNVRSAGWSLGAKGCIECHRDDGLIFASTVSAVGPLESSGPPIAMADLQGIDANQRLAWNQLFGGRASFKYVIAVSLTVLLAVLLIGVGALAGRRSGSALGSRGKPADRNPVQGEDAR